MCISMSAASENTRNAPMCSGSSSAVACGQEAPCKALGRTAASKSHTLSPATMQLRMATSKRRAVRRRCPVRVWPSLRRLRLRLEYLELSFNPRFRRDQNKTAGISVRPVSTGGMWRSQVSCCRIFPGLGLGYPVVSKGCGASREWPSCCLRTTVSPGLAI
jgi:hypothetical protein